MKLAAALATIALLAAALLSAALASSDDEPEGVEAEPASAGVEDETESVDPAAAYAAALGARDAGRLAQLLGEFPDEAGAAEAERLLRENAIYCVTRNGRLSGAGEAILNEIFPLHVTSTDQNRVAELAFPVTVRDVSLRVRHRNDYARGLGRRLDGRRLQPHPKKLSVELTWVDAKDGSPQKLVLEADTPFIDVESLDDRGLSDEAVWRRTLEPLLPALREAAGRAAAR